MFLFLLISNRCCLILWPFGSSPSAPMPRLCFPLPLLSSAASSSLQLVQFSAFHPPPGRTAVLTKPGSQWQSGIAPRCLERAKPRGLSQTLCHSSLPACVLVELVCEHCWAGRVCRVTGMALGNLQQAVRALISTHGSLTLPLVSASLLHHSRAFLGTCLIPICHLTFSLFRLGWKQAVLKHCFTSLKIKVGFLSAQHTPSLSASPSPPTSLSLLASCCWRDREGGILGKHGSWIQSGSQTHT